jgi:arylsulfatase A-like enzyme
VPQYSHVIDILPTTLELVGIRAPEQIRGIKQDAIEGTSLAYSIDDAKAPNRHTLQYYYIFGSRFDLSRRLESRVGLPQQLYHRESSKG